MTLREADIEEIRRRLIDASAFECQSPVAEISIDWMMMKVDFRLTLECGHRILEYFFFHAHKRPDIRLTRFRALRLEKLSSSVNQ